MADTAKITEALDEAAEHKQNYANACRTIAEMHAAAVGEVTGPARGVVEDVADVRTAMLRAEAERDRAYRERAHLVAHLASLYPATIGLTDPNAPDWPVITIETPAGQMTWHIAAADLDLFEHVERSLDAVWDRHTTEHKYERLQHLTDRAMSQCGPDCSEMHRGGPRCRA
ncbi:hypothetical protein [Streptomyces sp. NPDC056387]|uniref:WDGH domain-containing protein n=1 Tax=Streptomyces sp. NPDC056387 TaxID=3345803 RepID=UPI0035D8724D